MRPRSAQADLFRLPPGSCDASSVQCRRCQVGVAPPHPYSATEKAQAQMGTPSTGGGRLSRHFSSAASCASHLDQGTVYCRAQACA